LSSSKFKISELPNFASEFHLKGPQKSKFNFSRGDLDDEDMMQRWHFHRGHNNWWNTSRRLEAGVSRIHGEGLNISAGVEYTLELHGLQDDYEHINALMGMGN
jgi:hypothetical protein